MNRRSFNLATRNETAILIANTLLYFFNLAFISLMKNRISSNLRIIRFLFLALGLVLIYFIFLSFVQMPIATKDIIMKGLLLVLCLILYMLCDSAKTIEFDQESLYISGKSDEEKLPLGN